MNQWRSQLPPKATTKAFSFAVLIAMLLITGWVVLAQEATSPSLSELDRCHADAHLLKVRTAQLSAQLADVTAKLDAALLTGERAILIEAFRRTLKASPTATFDWDRLLFTEPPATPAETVK